MLRRSEAFIDVYRILASAEWRHGIPFDTIKEVRNIRRHLDSDLAMFVETKFEETMQKESRLLRGILQIYFIIYK